MWNARTGATNRNVSKEEEGGARSIKKVEIQQQHRNKNSFTVLLAKTILL